MPSILANKVSMLRRSAITACDIPRSVDNFRVYFQDFDGNVREVQYKDGYKGGDSKSVIAECGDAKYHTPLAVTASDNPNQQITLFYVSKGDLLRAAIYDGQKWIRSQLLQQGISLNAASQLACCTHDKKIHVYFQSPDMQIREIIQNEGDDTSWTSGTLQVPAIVGSGLAAFRLLGREGNFRDISVVLQSNDRNLRLYYWVESWNEGDLYKYVTNQSLQCSIAGVTYSSPKDGHVLRIYVGNPSSGQIGEVYVDHIDHPDWSAVMDLVPCLPDGKTASFTFQRNGNPEVRVFFQGADCELRGYNLRDLKYQDNHVLPTGEAAEAGESDDLPILL